ncbi:MAG: prepilin-type N-terminal cleavage/methylation domain-containing protein [Candidatus Omnitrophota bacterium]|jgi:hypothetical protein
MKRKSLTLVEVMISVFIFAIGVGAIFVAYPPLFEGVEVTFQTMRTWSECRREIEILKNRQFSELLTESDTENPHIFLNVPTVMLGVYYLDKIACVSGPSCTGGVLTDALRVTVVMSVAAKNRIVGEDKNLNGILDSGEDVNENDLLDSPITLTTIVTSQ